MMLEEAEPPTPLGKQLCWSLGRHGGVFCGILTASLW